VTHLARILRFAAVGVVNTVIYYGVYLLVHTQVSYLLAHICAFVVAMICSYFLNCFVTFKTSPSWRTFLLFPLSNVASFVIMTGGLQVAVAGLGIDQQVAPLLVALIAIPITYVAAHFIMVERTRHHRAPRPGVDASGAVLGPEG
jgi:putative flippase GtrA